MAYNAKSQVPSRIFAINGLSCVQIPNSLAKMRSLLCAIDVAFDNFAL